MLRQLSSLKESLERATAEHQANISLAEEYLGRRGIKRETADMFRLGVVRGDGPLDEQYRGRLSIPYIAANGAVVALRYRALDDSQPKYLSRSGAKPHLFGVSCLLGDAREVVIAEGEIDQMTLTQIGVTSVGVPGAQAWKKSWRFLFEDFDRVICLSDGDDAGKEFGKKMVDAVGAVAIELPPGEDTNSFFVKHGAEQLRSIIRAA